MTDSKMPMFQLEEVHLGFGAQSILEGFNLKIAPGEKVVLRGKSGTGKSSLLRLLLGFVRPDRGEVRFRGEAITPEVAWSLRKQCAYVNQGLDFESSTVTEALNTMGRLRSEGRGFAENALIAALAEFELGEATLTRKTGDLSGGERQRMALAAATLLDRPIFLLDEPTAALDEGQTRLVADFFLESQPDWTVVAVSHDEAWFQHDRATIVNLDDLPTP